MIESIGEETFNFQDERFADSLENTTSVLERH